MVKFLCSEGVFCVVMDVSHHLFCINKLKILNSNVMKYLVIFSDFAGWKRVFWASISLRIRWKMVKFLCFEVLFFVVLDLKHHLFFINNLKNLNSYVMKKLLIFCVFVVWKRVFSASISLRIREKMVNFICFEVLFCVVLDVSHHLYFINNLKILNSNVIQICSISAFSLAENAFSQYRFLWGQEEKWWNFYVSNSCLLSFWMWAITCSS
jgi:hypothetical protein